MPKLFSENLGTWIIVVLLALDVYISYQMLSEMRSSHVQR